MFDNITLVKVHPPSIEFLRKSKRGKPFEYRSFMFSPVYRHGNNIAFRTNFKNLRFTIFNHKVRLENSLHKFFHGGNCNDYTLTEIQATIETINQATGIDWNDSQVKYLEYGCNVPANARQVFNSLLNYKGKDYQSMVGKGMKYGAAASFEDYRIKGYDKEFAAKIVDRVNIRQSIFRWEIQAGKKHLHRVLGCSPLLSDLLVKDTFMLLMNDAVSKFNDSIKDKVMHLHKLTASQKKVIAAMQHPLIREDLRLHNKETYKRDRRIYLQIMRDNNICQDSGTGELIEQKFKELLNS